MTVDQARALYPVKHAEGADLRAEVVAEARTWLKTPFMHQQGLKGFGVDCLMLMRAIGENSQVMPRITRRQEERYWKYYGRRPQPVQMRKCLEEFLVEIPKGEAAVGDLMWSHWGNDMPIHMAVISCFENRRTLIHAIWLVDVAECTLTDVFTDRVTAYWRYPAIAAAEA